jgi:hypothetical protein
MSFSVRFVKHPHPNSASISYDRTGDTWVGLFLLFFSRDSDSFACGNCEWPSDDGNLGPVDSDNLPLRQPPTCVKPRSFEESREESVVRIFLSAMLCIAPEIQMPAKQTNFLIGACVPQGKKSRRWKTPTLGLRVKLGVFLQSVIYMCNLQ